MSDINNKEKEAEDKMNLNVEESKKSTPFVLAKILFNQGALLFSNLWKTYINYSKNNKKERKHKEYKEIFDGLGEMPKINFDGDVAANKRYFLEYMTDIGEKFRKAGVVDGEFGQKNYAVVDVIQTRVLQIRAYLEALFRGEFDKANVERKIKEDIYKTANNDCKEYAKHVDEIQEKSTKNFKNFSFLLGFTYLVIALFLIAADIPLAYKLTGDGFRLEFANAILMAVGLALSTIYIKIYYDEFVGAPIEEAVTRFKNLKDVEDSDIKKIKWSWRRKVVIKTMILLLSIVTILVLGIYRFEFYKKTELGNIKSDELQSVLAGDWTQAAFILVTLLFPIIGGVCASLGISNIQNFVESKKTIWKAYWKNKKKLNTLENWQNAIKSYETSKSYLNWCKVQLPKKDFLESKNSSTESIDRANAENKPPDIEEVGDFVKDYTMYFLSCYTHGYERGLTLSNLKKDIITKAIDFRRRMIAQKTAKATLKTTTEELYETLKTQI